VSIQNNERRWYSIAIAASSQNLIEQLSYGSFCFQYGVAMVHRSGQIGISKRDPTEWGIA
jgi:hypothetical protein